MANQFRSCSFPAAPGDLGQSEASSKRFTAIACFPSKINAQEDHKSGFPEVSPIYRARLTPVH